MPFKISVVKKKDKNYIQFQDTKTNEKIELGSSNVVESWVKTFSLLRKKHDDAFIRDFLKYRLLIQKHIPIYGEDTREYNRINALVLTSIRETMKRTEDIFKSMKDVLEYFLEE